MADSALVIAREMEAGRAVAPFQERLGQLRLKDLNPPVRAAILLGGGGWGTRVVAYETPVSCGDRKSAKSRR